MADEPENHTIRLLRELRDEMRVDFAMIRKRFERVDERLSSAVFSAYGIGAPPPPSTTVEISPRGRPAARPGS